MSALDHSKCRSLLGSQADYVDGTLGEKLCEEINRHVPDCENCKAEVDTLGRTISLHHKFCAEPGEVPDRVREWLFRTLNLDEPIKR